MEPDVYIHQDSPKSSWPYKKIFFALIILAILGLGILIFSIVRLKEKDKKPLDNPVNTVNLPSTINVVITTLHISKDGSATFIKSEPSEVEDPHLQESINQPSPDPSVYTFKVEVVSDKQQTLYYSWKQFPIKKTTDGGFDLPILTSYKAGSLLKVSNDKNKLIITVPLK